jgi:hypothetical protein
MSSDDQNQSHIAIATEQTGQFIKFPHVHPGHCLLMSSIPFCYGAYRAFHHPLDEVVRPVLHAHKVPIHSIDSAEEPIRRAVASAVAARALKVSSLASIGGFGIAGAIVFYAAGWNSFDGAMHGVENWAHDKRKDLDKWLGVANRIDRNHPEVTVTKGMSFDKEMEYISKTYMPDEDWEAETRDVKQSLP